MVRAIVSRLAFLVALCTVAVLVLHTYAADSAPLQLNVTKAGPREVEDTTQKAVARDYQRAWQSMSSALSENRPDRLGDVWVGVAKEKLLKQIDAQKSAKLTSRVIDRGHKLEAIFYSAEGSALQLRDTAQVETQILDGGKVVGSNSATVNYVIVMTPAVDHWQVRVMQAVPGT